jgi:hypothetical protein
MTSSMNDVKFKFMETILKFAIKKPISLFSSSYSSPLSMANRPTRLKVSLFASFENAFQ